MLSTANSSHSRQKSKARLLRCRENVESGRLLKVRGVAGTGRQPVMQPVRLQTPRGGKWTVGEYLK